MKKAIFILPVSALIITVLITTSAVAQDALPGEQIPDHLESLLAQTDIEPPPQAGDDLPPFIAGNRGTDTPDAPVVVLGQPGLSFRYVQTFSITQEGYTTDDYHLNTPGGMFIDGNDNLYVAEDHGCRVLRYSSDGVSNLTPIGIASLCKSGNDPIRFSFPRDISVDSDGNIWVAEGSRVVKFNSNGVYQLQLPVPDDSGTRRNGDDETNFSYTFGVALDNSNNRLYVSDNENHRVQVYTLIDGTPVYSTTIGETGIPGNDNQHFNYPTRLALDSSGRLYVVDRDNARVQRCTWSETTWSCAPFGTDVVPITPSGISISSSDWVYISDLANSSISNRILRCQPNGTCSVLVSDVIDAQDLAVDSNDNVFISASNHAAIRKYDPSGIWSGNEYLGTWNQAYFTDTTHLYTPWGIAIDLNGNLYVSEFWGDRFRKFNANGVQQWAVGDPGSLGNKINQLTHPEGKPVITKNKKIYVPDSGNCRIQIFNLDGSYDSTFGSCGTENDQFQEPAGIAISPINGDIYIADASLQRVMVYTSAFTPRTQLGITDTPGSDNAHFNAPYDVAVDTHGNIYVADNNNNRVQKCALSDSNYSCSTFAGNGVCERTGSFEELCPMGVTVDAQDRVYVADEGNHRVQVFDSNGAFLTTIGGGGGGNNAASYTAAYNSGHFSDPVGVTLDSVGNVYISDWKSHTVKKYAPGVPSWRQANINGFGSPENTIWSLTNYESALYAGTSSDEGAGVWRSNDATHWTNVTPAWSSNNLYVLGTVEYKSKLYIGTYSGEVWRTNGRTWQQITSNGFGDANNLLETLAVYHNKLYIAASNFVTGIEMWRSTNGNPYHGDWVQTNVDNFGLPGSMGEDTVMDIYRDYLYVGMSQGGVAELWRTDGRTWIPVFTDGLAANNTNVSALAVFKGDFYIGLRNMTTGGEVWKSSDGLHFSLIFNGGLGNPNNGRLHGLIVNNGRLYLIFSNPANGAEVWYTDNGNHWHSLITGGWGDGCNTIADYYDRAATVFKGKLYIGTANGCQGGEVWQLLK